MAVTVWISTTATCTANGAGPHVSQLGDLQLNCGAAAFQVNQRVSHQASYQPSVLLRARWDYAVGVHKSGSDRVVWIEVHSASSHHVDEVLSKLRWLLQWLANSATALNELPRRFCWIATGTVSINRGSPQARRLAAMGLRFPAKHVDVEEVIGD
jgi:hypothetical protein